MLRLYPSALPGSISFSLGDPTLLFYAPLVLTVLSNLVYHIFLKLTHGSINPMISLAVTYVTTAGVCLLLLRFFPLQSGLAASVRQLNWASYALGLAGLMLINGKLKTIPVKSSPNAVAFSR